MRRVRRNQYRKTEIQGEILKIKERDDIKDFLYSLDIKLHRYSKQVSMDFKAKGNIYIYIYIYTKRESEDK